MSGEYSPLPTVTARDIWRFTFHYWRKKARMMAVVIVMITICTLIQNIVVPLSARRITDFVAQGYDHYLAHKDVLWGYFIVFAGASIFQASIWTVAIYIWNIFSSHILYHVLGNGLHKVQRFSADWHANTFAGGTVRKITRGMSSFDMFSDRIVLGFFVIISAMTITIITVSTRLPYVSLFMAAMTIAYFLISLYVSRRYQLPLFQNAAEADTKMGSTLADIITGIPTIKTFASEHREDEHFRAVRREWRDRALKAWQVSRIIDGARTVMRLTMLIGMLGITLLLWLHGRATPGDVTLVLTCYFLTQHMLRDMGTFINDVQKSMSEMEDIVAFWMREDDVRDAPGAKDLVVAHEGGVIHFDDVWFQYKNTDRPIYRGLSVEIRPGEKVALVGMSGSGKTTFIKLLQRLYDIQSGSICIDGQNIARVTQQSLRSRIALVPQDPVLFHRSIADNIAYGRPSATRAEIEQAAKLAFAHDFIMSFPKGYDTFVGERGVKLSGGERQRVAIARAILSEAPILVLDEATSSLDSVSEHYIQMGLENLVKGRTTITVAHRLATIRSVDRILVFQNGEIVEQGTHESLLAAPKSIYKKLYDMQALELSDIG